MTIKIGTTLWGGDYGRPDKWRSEVVVDETKASWIVGDPKHCRLIKINKRTLRETVPRFGPIQWYTEQGKRDFLFLRKHRSTISSLVSCVDSADILRKIGDTLGYPFDEEA